MCIHVESNRTPTTTTTTQLHCWWRRDAATAAAPPCCPTCWGRPAQNSTSSLSRIDMSTLRRPRQQSRIGRRRCPLAKIRLTAAAPPTLRLSPLLSSPPPLLEFLNPLATTNHARPLQILTGRNITFSGPKWGRASKAFCFVFLLPPDVWSVIKRVFKCFFVGIFDFCLFFSLPPDFHWGVKLYICGAWGEVCITFHNVGGHYRVRQHNVPGHYGGRRRPTMPSAKLERSNSVSELTCCPAVMGRRPEYIGSNPL